ncbi:unnamed protein product [marine sediment metagenome]|uniref:DUF2061 domain-containing protein n=1 Tax=marine sediment metagenome TaxID=412755 RepID=X0URE1_9ZZZZ
MEQASDNRLLKTIIYRLIAAIISITAGYFYIGDWRITPLFIWLFFAKTIMYYIYEGWWGKKR